MDEKLQELLRELGRVVQEAVAESSDVGDALQQIRREGYTLYLSVSCRREDDDEAPTPPRALGNGQPEFRIDGSDLGFLRSIGIDPTRKMKRRRRA